MTAERFEVIDETRIEGGPVSLAIVDRKTRKVVYRVSSLDEPNPRAVASRRCDRMNANPECERCRTDPPGGPSHTPSIMCRMGGRHPHCACRACF